MQAEAKEERDIGTQNMNVCRTTWQGVHFLLDFGTFSTISEGKEGLMLLGT